MPDFLSLVERGLKAVRYGFFCVNDQLALALDGLCHAPAMDYVDYTEHLDPDIWEAARRLPDSAVSPQAADADSTPEAAVSRPSAKSALMTPAEGHLNDARLAIAELYLDEMQRQGEAKDAIPFRWHGGRASAFAEVLRLLAPK